MASSTASHSNQLCRRCARRPCERERQPLFTTVPVLAKMSKQILKDTFGLVLDPWNWKVRLYGTHSRMTQDRHSDYQRDATHKVYQFDAAPNKINLDSQPGPSPRVLRSTSKPVHESKREKKTVHFLEPDYRKKPSSGPGHAKFPAERANLDLYEVVCPANDIPRVIDIDYDTKDNRWCIDDPHTFPDREDRVAMICSRSVLRAIQFADSSTRRSTPASSTRLPQFQINRLPNHGVIKNPGGDLATLKASSHDLFHIGNLEKFLLHTHEYPQHILKVNGWQYMKHWLIDLRQLVTVLSKPDVRKKCKSAFWDLVHHGVAEKVTLQLWGAGDLQPEASTDIETLDWATWVRLYRNQISETLRRDLDRALGFLHPDTVPGSSSPAAVHPNLSIMSHKGLTSSVNALAEIRNDRNSSNVEPWYASSPVHDIPPEEMKQTNPGPTNASNIMERLSSNNNDVSARVRTPYARISRLAQSTRPLPQAPGPHPYPRSVDPPLRPWSPAFELQDSADDSDFPDMDVPNEEDVSGTYRRALAEVDYGKETGGLVDPNNTASGAPVDEKRPIRNLTRLLKEPRTGTSAYERLKGHFKDPGLVESRKRALKSLVTSNSRRDKTMDNATSYPAFSNQLDDALAAKQRLIQSLTATQQDLERARQDWTKDQEILRNAGLLKRDLRVDLEEKWAASRLLEVYKCLAELDELRNKVSERAKMSNNNSDAGKDEMGQREGRMEMASPQSVLDTVVDESNNLEGIEQDLTQTKDSIQPDMEQGQCPEMLASHIDRPHIASEDAAKRADNDGLRHVTVQDPVGNSNGSLKHSTRRSWTPEDDKASFRLSAPQQTSGGLDNTRAEYRCTSPSPDVPSHQGHIRPEVDPTPAPTTPGGSNISVFGSVSPSTDGKEVASEANGSVRTESDKVSMCSGSGLNPVNIQADHPVNHLSADSSKSVRHNGPLLADGDPFDVVTNSCISPDGTAAYFEKLPQDDCVTGPNELAVDNAVQSPQTMDNHATIPDHSNRNKFTGIKRLADLDNAVLFDSEEPEGISVEGHEELETEALLVSPTKLTTHIRSSPSSSGKKKGAARKKWTRVQWVD